MAKLQECLVFIPGMGSERQDGPFTGLVEGNKLLTMLVSIPRMASSVRLILISGMVSEEWLVSYFAMQISDERLDTIPGILRKRGWIPSLPGILLIRGWIPYLEFFGREAGSFTGIDAEEWLVLVQEMLYGREAGLYTGLDTEERLVLIQGLIRKRGWSLYRA